MFLEIVSPETKLFQGTVTAVTLPGSDGSFQILNHHAAIVSLLVAGDIKIAATAFTFSKEAVHHFIKVNEQTYTLAISSGTLEMKDNKIIILVD